MLKPYARTRPVLFRNLPPSAHIAFQVKEQVTPTIRMGTHVQGRVIARQAAFNALDADLVAQTTEAQTLLVEKKSQVFTTHHSALIKVPQSVRGKELVDFLEQWLTPEEVEEAVAEVETKEVEKEEGCKVEEEAPTVEKEEAPKEEAEAPKEEAEALKKEAEAPKEEVEAPKEEVEDSKEEVEASKEEKALPKEEKASPKASPKASKKKKEPSPYRPRAKEIAEALVLAGFITPYKDRVKNYLADAPKEYVIDNELFVPLSDTITESNDTTVWNVVDGAIYASQVKRKAGVFSAFTQGKDVYVVANEKTKKIYFFESDVARAALVEYNTADVLVQFDNSHFQFGVKLVYGEKFELLNLVTK